ncbi:hypothetical protein FOL47_006703 [Perkinsus chesapeaki]|uniref:Uncharacterized protein n=1 Tax=Perkinsus chesapeaki TaxID=330153 RepID=A0A7J6MWX5_PERCH|nr:hypothetical protein FOL47_006703 [Perkinsus chesapeaki]
MKDGDRIDALAEQVIDVLDQGAESDEDGQVEKRKCLSVLAGNLASSQKDVMTAEVAGAVQKKLEKSAGRQRNEEEETAGKDGDQGYCHDGFFSEVLPLSANLRILNYLDPTEGEYLGYAAICRATCVATNMQLEYIYLLVRIIRFVVFGPSVDDDDSDDEGPSDSTSATSPVAAIPVVRSSSIMVQKPLGKKKSGKAATQRVNKPKQGKAKSVAEKIMHRIGGTRQRVMESQLAAEATQTQAAQGNTDLGLGGGGRVSVVKVDKQLLGSAKAMKRKGGGGQKKKSGGGKQSKK